MVLSVLTDERSQVCKDWSCAATTFALRSGLTYTYYLLPQAILYIALLVRAVSLSSAFTGAIILVNAAPHPSQLGSVNGVGQSVASFVRGVGPAAAGLLWSASLGLSGAHQFMPFGVVTVIAVAAIVLFNFFTIDKWPGCW
jgi:hypothetical protein